MSKNKKIVNIADKNGIIRICLKDIDGEKVTAWIYKKDLGFNAKIQKNK